MGRIERSTYEQLEAYKVMLAGRLNAVAMARQFLGQPGGEQRYFDSVCALWQELMPSLRGDIPDPDEELLKAEEQAVSRARKQLTVQVMRGKDVFDMQRMGADLYRSIYYTVAKNIYFKIMDRLDKDNLLIQFQTRHIGGSRLTENERAGSTS